jgi:hypothetical protein
MSNLLSQNKAALKMLLTEDIYSIVENPARKLVQPAVKESPVLQAPEKAENKGTLKPDFEYLGENNKYFLVLIDDKIHTRINPVHQEMLLKVMTAKKLELRDLAIVNMNRYPEAKFKDLKAFFSCSRLLMFGFTPAQIGMGSIPLNRVESAENVKVLSTFSLEEMRNSDDKKREFWNIMKNF